MGSFGLYPKSKIYLGFGQGFDIFHSNQSSNPKSQPYSIKKNINPNLLKKKICKQEYQTDCNINQKTKFSDQIEFVKKRQLQTPKHVKSKITKNYPIYTKLSRKKNYSKFYGLLENPGKNSKLLKISELTENVGNKTISNYLKYSKVNEIPQN